MHYRANPAAATYRDDLDRAVAMALFPQDHRVLLWAGEVGELTPNAKAAPHMRQAPACRTGTTTCSRCSTAPGR
jgi:hypothetical protein